jgi:hypothetical protein
MKALPDNCPGPATDTLTTATRNKDRRLARCSRRNAFVSHWRSTERRAPRQAVTGCRCVGPWVGRAGAGNRRVGVPAVKRANGGFNGSVVRRLLQCLPLFSLAFVLPVAQAEQIAVLHPQGSAHGFVEVTTLEGTRIATGDLVQGLHGHVVTSRLTMNFLDGSLDDETTVFSQEGTFRLISDHHVQHGASFPKPIDVTINASHGEVSSTDQNGKVTNTRVVMPSDVSNGLASKILLNVLPTTPQTKVAFVVASDKPRVAYLSVRNGGEVPFTIGGTPRRATDYVIHVELGGVAGVVAPVIGKEPLDYHVLILTGGEPAFIREEGQFYDGGPVWRIQQISAVFPKT